MKSRKIEAEIIAHFQMENIDCAAISALDDNSLKALIPKYGDRVALRDYCKKQTGPKKYSIIEKIKHKIALKNAVSEENTNVNLSHSSQRKTRIISLGWICSNDEGQIKQVRAKQGGGTREVAMPLCSTMSEVEKKAVDFFFPNKISPRGHISEIEVKLLDFKHNVVEDAWTIEGIYTMTGVNRLRFYLSTIKIRNASEKKATTSHGRTRHSSDSDFEEVPPKARPKRISKYIISDEENEVENKDGLKPDNLSLNEGSEHLSSIENPVQDYLFSFLADETENEVDPTFSSSMPMTTTHLTNKALDITYLTEEELFDVQVQNTESRNILTLPSLAEDSEIITICISRDNCVEEMFSLYSDPEIVSKRLVVNFKDEIGIDGGGLTKELFNLFFGKIETKYFRGEETLVPYLPLNKARKEQHNFVLIGRIIEHMLLLTGNLPSKISVVTYLLISNLDNKIDEKLLLEEFFLFTNAFERYVLKKAVSDFSKLSQKEKDIIVNFFNTYQFFEMPSNVDIREQLLSIANDVFIEKTKTFIMLLRKGLNLDKYQTFWKSGDFTSIISLQKATPSKVASCLKTVSDDLTNSQLTVFHFLEMYIRCLTPDSLRQFLFFVTGSYQMPVTINVEFTNLSGYERRPMVRTCSNLIEISTHYYTYQEFKKDLDDFILSSYSYEYTIC